MLPLPELQQHFSQALLDHPAHDLSLRDNGLTGLRRLQVYRDQTRDGSSIWAFPIVHMGKYAALEEMGFDNIPVEQVRSWLLATADYAATSPMICTLR